MKKEFKISIVPTHKQQLCWDKLKDHITRFILFGGGAGGGKSWVGCEWLMVMCIAFPGTKWFIGRNELKRIMKSTFITFKKVCTLHKIPNSSWKLNEKYSYIQFWNGSRIDLIDVAYKPADPLYERFGSEEYTGGWLEEVGEIKGKAFDVLKSRIGRHFNKKYNLYPKILLTCNPKKNWVYFDYYKLWKSNEMPADSCFIQSLYGDNPYTADSYGELLSTIKDPVMKQRLKFGLWEYEDDDSALMTYEKIIEVFTREQVPNVEQELYQTSDIARKGRDKSVIILWQGWFIRKIWWYDKNSPDKIIMPRQHITYDKDGNEEKSVTWHYSKSPTAFIEAKLLSNEMQWHIPRENGAVDQDGVGGGVVDHLPGIYAFVNAGKPVDEFDDDKKYRQQETDKFSYKNLRAQCYDRLADYINEGIIGCYKGIDPDVRNWIIEELEAIRRKDMTDNEKKFQIISKDDIKDAIGRSPDFGDALMERMVFELGKPRATVAEGDDGGFEVDIAW